MVLKTNRYNGAQFWGCSRYPECRGALPLDYDKREIFYSDESIWFISRARAERAKVEFVQSVGIPSNLLNHLLLHDELYQDIKRFSHWRFDFKPTRLIANDEVQYVCNIAYKILTRGRITTISPFVEEKLTDTFGLNYRYPNSFEFFIDHLSSNNDEIAFFHDGYGIEKIFYKEIMPRIGGKNYFNYLIPQADIATLIGSNKDFGNQRVDFAINDGMLKLIIELDDYQHNKHKEYDQYRDKVLQDNGFEVIRIPNLEVRNGKGPHIDELAKLLAPYRSAYSGLLPEQMKGYIAAKIIHQIQIVTVYALQHVACTHTSNIHLELNSTIFSKEEERRICAIASEDLNQLLNNIAKLCSFNSIDLIPKNFVSRNVSHNMIKYKK